MKSEDKRSGVGDAEESIYSYTTSKYDGEEEYTMEYEE